MAGEVCPLCCPRVVTRAGTRPRSQGTERVLGGVPGGGVERCVVCSGDLAGLKGWGALRGEGCCRWGRKRGI